MTISRFSTYENAIYQNASPLSIPRELPRPARCGHSRVCEARNTETRESRSLTTMRKATAKTFWTRVIETDGCWEWVGSHFQSSGYARVKFHGRDTCAHIIAWELTNGPVPRGLELDHLCRNRGCVRPSHLEPVTHRENEIRGQTVIRANAIKTECLRGHPLAGANLMMRGPRRQCRLCHNARGNKSKMLSPTYKARHAELERLRRKRLKEAA